MLGSAGVESGTHCSLTHRAWALSFAGRRCVSFCPPVAMVSVTLFITASVSCIHGRERLSRSRKEVGQTGGSASGWAGRAGFLPVCLPAPRGASPVPSTPQKWSCLHAAPRPLHPRPITVSAPASPGGGDSGRRGRRPTGFPLRWCEPQHPEPPGQCGSVPPPCSVLGVQV